MHCSKCNSQNDADARFCAECGAGLGRTKRSYLYALLLVPVIVFAAAIGYYKFFLPQGVAAVVNGEEISISELDHAVARVSGAGRNGDSRMRYQVLNGLINERLALQEARKAGTEISAQELADAMSSLRAQSHLSESGFKARAEAEYGSLRAYEENMKRVLVVNKFIASKIVPANADPKTANLALSRWMHDLSVKAVVRVTLAEELSGGCGCGNHPAASPASSARPGCKMGSGGCKMAGGKPVASTSDADKARDAALLYWREHHGPEPVTTKITDFGCHIQVDILQNNKNVGSLRYQAGTISES